MIKSYGDGEGDLHKDTHELLAMDQDWIAEMFLRDLHPIIARAAQSWWHT